MRHKGLYFISTSLIWFPGSILILYREVIMSSSQRIHYQRFYPMCDQFVGYNVACVCLLEYPNQVKPGWTFYSLIYSRILIESGSQSTCRRIRIPILIDQCQSGSEWVLESSSKQGLYGTVPPAYYVGC